eukprot:7170536-Prymnesium_polylepis.2
MSEPGGGKRCTFYVERAVCGSWTQAKMALYVDGHDLGKQRQFPVKMYVVHSSTAGARRWLSRKGRWIRSVTAYGTWSSPRWPGGWCNFAFSTTRAP